MKIELPQYLELSKWANHLELMTWQMVQSFNDTENQELKTLLNKITPALIATRHELETFVKTAEKQPKPGCRNSCGPGDWQKGGKCDVNGCYYE